MANPEDDITEEGVTDDTSTSKEEKAPEPSPLGMSDEDLLDMPIPSEEPVSEDKTDDTVTDDDADKTDDKDDDDDSSKAPDESEGKADEEDAAPKEDDKAQGEKSKGESDSGKEKLKESGDESDKKPDKSNDTIDYKKEYERLLAPFRANNREMKVGSVDDAITLMQMGANYNHKMAALKPNLKLMKMLDNNKLLSEEKLSYLIDLDKKDPDAIIKLIKDSGVNPLDIDVEEKSKYKPNAYTVDDKEVDLDTVLSDIKNTDSYKSTLDIISNKWDEASKQRLYAEPNIIRVINDQVASGVYDQIMSEVDMQRALSKLTGVSDLEAYFQVGQAIQERRGFKGQTQIPTPAATKQGNNVPDPKLKERKKAAGGTKNSVSTKKKADFNPLSLSDDEFSKLSANDYLT